MSNDAFERKVERVDQSPMNAQRWVLELSCGHEEWVTSKRRPTSKTVNCSRCKQSG
jgi:hypothetical protein